MITTKNPPSIEEENIRKHNGIVPSTNIDFQAPEIIKEAVNLYKEKFINLSDRIILNTLLVKMFQWLSFYRVNFYDIENGISIIPNWFILILAPSGYGKDYLLNDFSHFIFKSYDEQFKNKVEEYECEKKRKIEVQALEEYDNQNQRKNFIKEATRKIRHIESETQNATCEGFYSDCKTLNEVAFGGPLVRINEFAGFLNSLNQEKSLFLETMFNAYDGIIESKSIKSENRDATIKNMPVNAIFYSDYSSLLNKSTKESTALSILLDRGLARRLTTTFVPQGNRKPDKKTQKEKIALNNKSTKLGNKVNDIFSKLNFGMVYKITESGYDNILCEYEEFLNNEYNKTNSDKLQREIMSRSYKVKKLACLYAVLNHTEIKEIQEKDLRQAISTVEYLSADFKKMLKYKQNKPDVYDKLLDYFLENLEINKKVATTELKNQFTRFDYTRDRFYREFNTIIATFKDIVKDNNYTLVEEKGDKNRTLYYLIPIKENDEFLEFKTE